MQQPLADRLRPRTLAEVCGQQHLLGPGRVFRKAIESVLADDDSRDRVLGELGLVAKEKLDA